MGGYAALALYELRPAMVRTLTLIDTRATPDSVDARAARDTLAEQLLESGRTDFAGKMIPTLLGPRPTRAVRSRLRSMIEGTRYETMVASLEGMKDRPDRIGPAAADCGSHAGDGRGARCARPLPPRPGRWPR